MFEGIFRLAISGYDLYLGETDSSGAPILESCGRKFYLSVRQRQAGARTHSRLGRSDLRAHRFSGRSDQQAHGFCGRSVDRTGGQILW